MTAIFRYSQASLRGDILQTLERRSVGQKANSNRGSRLRKLSLYSAELGCH